MKMKERVTEEMLEFGYLLKKRYLIGDFLQKGEQHSHIYRAYDTALDQEVVIKEFVPGDPDGAEAWTKAFTEEAGKFFGVYEYRGITEIMDVFQDGEHAYMAMEYLPGKNLRQYLEGQKKKQITAENAWTLLLPALEAVSFLHSTGMVHGGITMERLIFDENDTLCLTGLGDCFLRTKKDTAGPWTDVRAVAEILYECLTGKAPSQAGRFGDKKKVRSISTWADVSSRADETILGELNRVAGGGCFGIYALAEQLGMKNDSLEVYLGAIQSTWGEKWLDLTEKYQRDHAEADRMTIFMTRKRRRAAGILLGVLVIAGASVSGYVHTHERQILEFQIQRDHEKYQKDPVFLLSAEKKEAKEIWNAAREEGTVDETVSSPGTAYKVSPEFMDKRNLAGNASQGFSIRDRHLKKRIEEELGIPLEEKSSDRECSISYLGEKTAYLELCNQKTIVYTGTEKGEERSLEIISDAENGRVDSCTVVLSKEEIKIFLGEVFSEIVPETYFTDAETEEIFAQAEQNGYYDFEDHGKFRMSLLKKQNTTDEGEVFYNYQLGLTSYASETEAESETAAGSYTRNSEEYKEFLDFVKTHAVKSEKEEFTTLYMLPENAVREWNQPSNLKLLKKTRKDFIKILESQKPSFEQSSEENLFQVTDCGMGALKAQFLRKQDFASETGQRISLLYDLVSERIYRINVAVEREKAERDCALAADLVTALSEDCSESEDEIISDLKKNLSELSETEGTAVYQYDYMDLSRMILRDDENTIQFIIRANGILDGRKYSVSEIQWPQNGEN